jgi:hypothetical protein
MISIAHIALRDSPSPGTILTYGQTGSGKSFSMFGAGDLVNGPLRGIVPVILFFVRHTADHLRKK